MTIHDISVISIYRAALETRYTQTPQVYSQKSQGCIMNANVFENQIKFFQDQIIWAVLSTFLCVHSLAPLCPSLFSLRNFRRNIWTWSSWGIKEPRLNNKCNVQLLIAVTFHSNAFYYSRSDIICCSTIIKITLAQAVSYSPVNTSSDWWSNNAGLPSNRDVYQTTQLRLKGTLSHKTAPGKAT